MGRKPKLILHQQREALERLAKGEETQCAIARSYTFNAHLKDCVVLFADEAFYAGDKKHESILKQIVAQDTIMIERKGVDMVQTPNCIHLIMASNSDWIVPAGHEEL